MTIKSKRRLGNHIEIDLTGPEGNAYNLMAQARSLGHQIFDDEVAINNVIEEMTMGDYEHLVKTFDDYFGHLVTLYR